MDGDLNNSIKLKIPIFKVKPILRLIWSGKRRWIGFFNVIVILRRKR